MEDTSVSVPVVRQATCPLDYAGPFAPPVAARLGVWRDGRTLLLFDGSALPSRCIKCGDPGHTHPLVLRLVWLPPAMRWLGGFVFILLGFARRTRMEVSLCDRCHRRRQFCLRWGAILLLAGVVLFVHAAFNPTHDNVAASAIFFLASALFLRRARPVTVRGLSYGVVQVGGAAPAYLSALPIGGPPGVGVTPDDLADRLAHVRDRRRRKRGRKRSRHRRQRQPSVTED